MNKTERLELLKKLTKIIKIEREIFKTVSVSKMRRKDGEFLSFDNYYDILDVVYQAYLNKHRDDYERNFTSPGGAINGRRISWITRDESFYVNRSFGRKTLVTGPEHFHKTGHIGDIITDIIYDTNLKPERKNEMLEHFFNLSEKILKSKKFIVDKR